MTLPCVLCPYEEDGCRKSCQEIDSYVKTYREIERINLALSRAKKEEEHRRLVEKMRLLPRDDAAS